MSLPGFRSAERPGTGKSGPEGERAGPVGRRTWRDVVSSDQSQLLISFFPLSRCDAAKGSRQRQAAGSSPQRHDPERHRGESVAAGQSDRPGRIWLDLFR